MTLFDHVHRALAPYYIETYLPARVTQIVHILASNLPREDKVERIEEELARIDHDNLPDEMLEPVLNLVLQAYNEWVREVRGQ